MNANIEAKEKEMAESARLLDAHVARQVRDAKPMQVLAGPALSPVNGVARAVAGEDKELLEKTKGLRVKVQDPLGGFGKRCLRDETLMEFFARTGISAHQVRTLTRRELERLHAVVEQHQVRTTPLGALPPRGPVLVDTWT